MPTIPHEAPLELVRRNPQLVAVLLRALGVPVPEGADAHLVPADQTASVPVELRADAVVLLPGPAKLAVVVEVQLRYDADKQYSWPAYLTQVRAVHRCPVVLLVICLNARTARRCRAPISMGHPGWDLTPLVIDAATVPPLGGPGTAPVVPELMVLRVLTGALDLEQDSARRQVLAALGKLDYDRRTTYTVFIRRAVSGLARQELEGLMATTHPFRDDFVDRWLAEGEARGEAKGEAQMILRVLAARGVPVPADARRQLLSCTDTRQLARWGDRAATATTVAEVFSP